MYPRGDQKSKKETIPNSFLPEGYDFIRFGMREKKSMFLRSILYSTLEKYRKDEKESTRDSLLSRFRDDIEMFLKKKSPFDGEKITKECKKMALKKYEKENPKSPEVYIEFLKPGDIKTGVITFDKKNAYPIFNDTDSYKPDSNIFVLNNFKFTSEYIYKRITEKKMRLEVENILPDLEKNDVKCDFALSLLKEYQTIREEARIKSPLNFKKTISSTNNSFLSDSALENYSSILNLNICFVRAWESEVSVEKFIYFSEFFPTIIVFVIREGYYGKMKNYTATKFLPGGITHEGKVKFVLDPEEDEILIFQLLNYDVSNNASILQQNYNLFLSEGGMENTKELESIETPKYGDLKRKLGIHREGKDIKSIIKSIPMV